MLWRKGLETLKLMCASIVSWISPPAVDLNDVMFAHLGFIFGADAKRKL